MDLSTLLKKVRQREYKDKKAFTDDLNLIWDNCFEYNTWAEHPLRRSASILRNRGNHLLQFVNDVPPKPSAPPTSSGMPGFRYSRPSSFRADSTVPPSEADADGSVVDMPAPANDQLPLASKPFSRLEMFRNTLPLSPAHSRSATPFDRTVREESGEKPQKPSEPTEELLLLQQEELADYRATLVDPAKAELPNIPVPVASSSKHAIAEAQGQSFVEYALRCRPESVTRLIQADRFAPLPDSLCQAIYDSVRLCSKVRKLNRAALQAHPSFEQPMPIIINGDSSSEEEDDDPTDDDEAILKGVLPLQFGTATLYNTQAASTVARRDLSSSISLLLANAGFQGALTSL